MPESFTACSTDSTLSATRLTAAYEKARADLLAERTEDGHWVGELASSALSTATAVSALSLIQQAEQAAGASPSEADLNLIAQGVSYLERHQNADGGWGDTDKSHSNLATTMLSVAAIHLAQAQECCHAQLARAERYISNNGRIAGLRARYGRDKTFAVPILTNCALAGLVPWSDVAPLPFELACLPQRFYRWAQLPVVSYAIPALVAIGHARFVHQRPRFPLTRIIRQAAVPRSLRVLESMQPESGGYLEAVPLTSFVAMSLAATGRVSHAVTQAARRFLRNSVRADGSWPIDTNLATWTTSLAINALASDPTVSADVANLHWLLACQHRQRHPFTGADPGGWGWTDLSGAVPDADDTPGALLACARWPGAGHRSLEVQAQVRSSAEAGVRWLLDLQNRDGGWPTFCRGWGKLPFDRSGADLTAHAMRALAAWRDVAPRQIDRALRRGWAYLARVQRPDGSWVPLWFGNQDQPQEENPVYGTARVLLAYAELGMRECEAARRGARWLANVQHADGGWGGGLDQRSAAQDTTDHRRVSSVEETAVALEAALAMGARSPLEPAVAPALTWLVDAVEHDRHRETAPIGFYFAKLWYYEKLYPMIFSVAALGQAVHRRGERGTHH